MNFVTSEELPEYWLELVERNKLRINILSKYSDFFKLKYFFYCSKFEFFFVIYDKKIVEGILKTIKKYNMKYDKKKHKEEIFLKMESIVSEHLNSIKK